MSFELLPGVTKYLSRVDVTTCVEITLTNWGKRVVYEKKVIPFDNNIKSSLYNFTNLDSINNRFSIPKGGHNYCIIPFDPNVGHGYLAGGTEVIKGCRCNTKGSDNLCRLTTSGSKIYCDSVGTLCDCCTLVMASPLRNLEGGGILLSCDLVESGSRNTYISKSSGSNALQLEVEIREGIAYTKRKKVPFEKRLKTTLFNLTEIGFNGSSFSIPNDGNKYFIIPFDNTRPTILSSGDYTFDCECNEGGGHQGCILYFSFGTHFCGEYGCGCCALLITGGGPIIHHIGKGGGVLIKAFKVVEQ